MPTSTITTFGTDGKIISVEEVDAPAPAPDPFEQMQAQIDALTDIVLGATS